MIYHVLHNPLAGQGHKDPVERLSSLTAAGDQLRSYDVTTLTDYPAFLASVSEEDSLVISGGDGTLNRFVNDTDGLEIPCDILYLPSGSGNDFLRDLDKTPEDCPLSVKDYLRNLPYVEVKGKRYRFLNNVGFGIDGYCCEEGDNQRQKHPDKPVNYTSIAITGLLFHYKPTTATVTVDGQTYTYKKAWLAPTMKGRFYGGGMMATPEQDRTAPDGGLSLMLFYGANRLAILMAFPSIFKGEHVRRKKLVAIHRGYDIHVVFDGPRAVQIDGETITGVTEYRAYAPSKATEA